MALIDEQIATSTTTSVLSSDLTNGQTRCRKVVLQNNPGSGINISVGNPDSQSFVLTPGDSRELPVRTTDMVAYVADSGTPNLNVHVYT